MYVPGEVLIDYIDPFITWSHVHGLHLTAIFIHHIRTAVEIPWSIR